LTRSQPDNPCYIKLANTWIILNSGGGPTPDKPVVLLETPSDLNRVNSFLNLRVADIWACHKQWRDKGAFFLIEPLDNHGWEWRCYMRDPDGYLIEVGQYTEVALNWFKETRRYGRYHRPIVFLPSLWPNRNGSRGALIGLRKSVF